VSIDFLTPLGALLALSVVLPLAAFALVERRAARVRFALRLEEPARDSRVPVLLVLASVPALLAVAATQPVIRLSETHRVRLDAQTLYVVDVSRSMLASRSPDGASRFDRARRAALRMNGKLADVPAGVATMTDRVLPNVFPTSDATVFAATIDEALAINSPPPRGTQSVGTHFAALDALAGTNLFSPSARRRVAVILTDGESRTFDAAELRAALATGPPTYFVVLRVGSAGERIWATEADRAYRADPASDQTIAQLTRATRAKVFSEGRLDQATRAVRALVGDGPVRRAGETLRTIPLARWVVLAALLPLAFLLWRWNVPSRRRSH
jgi:von Willebrand factor type A domain